MLKTLTQNNNTKSKTKRKAQQMSEQKMTIRKFLQDYIPNRNWADKSSNAEGLI